MCFFSLFSINKYIFPLFHLSWCFLFFPFFFKKEANLTLTFHLFHGKYSLEIYPKESKFFFIYNLSLIKMFSSIFVLLRFSTDFIWISRSLLVFFQIFDFVINSSKLWVVHHIFFFIKNNKVEDIFLLFMTKYIIKRIIFFVSS